MTCSQIQTIQSGVYKPTSPIRRAKSIRTVHRSLRIVTVIAGQTPLIENENILDHPEELITPDDIEHIEPITNPIDLVKAIDSTLPQGQFQKLQFHWLIFNQSEHF